MSRLAVRVSRLEGWMSAKLETTESKSPLVLNDYGKKTLQESGFNTIFETMKEELLAAVAANNPRNRYQVQTESEKVMLTMVNDERFEPLQKYIYEHPKVNIPLILMTGAIPLRDYYLEKHPEIEE